MLDNGPKDQKSLTHQYICIKCKGRQVYKAIAYTSEGIHWWQQTKSARC